MNRGLLIFPVILINGLILTSCMDKKIQKENMAINPENMKQDVSPGEDFFEYANGAWIENNPIGDEYSQYGAFTELREKNKEQLKELVKEVSAMENAKPGGPAQKIRDFYNSGMDTGTIDNLGIKPLMPYLERINKLESKEDLENEIAYLHKTGINPLFGFFGSADPGNSDMVIATLNQGGLGLPDVEYYTADDPRSKEIRARYIDHVAKMLQFSGMDETQAQKDAETIMKIETRLAENSMTRLERRNPVKTYNKMSVEELIKLAPEFNWANYFNAIDAPEFEEINVRMPDFYSNLSNMINEVPVKDWKPYLKWNLINRNANFLSSDIEKADFGFYQGFLSGVKEMRPRWKRIMDFTSGYLGEPVGKIYVEKHFPPEAKERMVELVGNLKESLAHRIDKVVWMSDSTKQKALEKLDAMTVKVGYPDPEDWVDYSSMEIIEGDFLANIYNARKFHSNRNLSEIGKPVNKNEWVMPPQTVNAGYIPSYNQIIFPAGILQPPFFFMDADDAVNYGAIGVVIGHEMTHGFDDQGRQFDKDGNLTNWWTETDATGFEEQSKVLVDQFDNFKLLDSLHVNGKLTLGENIADNGGLNISWEAFIKAKKNKEQNKIQNFTPEQRFFLAYAQLWRNVIRTEELMRRLKEDVHSPGIARVNGALVNIDPFYKAFDISPEDKLYLAPDQRAYVW